MGVSEMDVSVCNHSVVVWCEPWNASPSPRPPTPQSKRALRSPPNERPPQRDAAGRFVIYVEETYVDQLKALRRSGENYSDVILRLAEPEATRATVVKLTERE
jgi:hypothetical protein